MSKIVNIAMASAIGVFTVFAGIPAALAADGGGSLTYVASTAKPFHKRILHTRRIDRSIHTDSISNDAMTGMPDQPVVKVQRQQVPGRGDYYTGPNRMQGFKSPSWPINQGANSY